MVETPKEIGTVDTGATEAMTFTDWLLERLEDLVKPYPPEPEPPALYTPPGLQPSDNNPSKLVRKHKPYDVKPIFVQVEVDEKGMARTIIKNKVVIVQVLNWQTGKRW
jgi:hypothetical protein